MAVVPLVAVRVIVPLAPAPVSFGVVIAEEGCGEGRAGRRRAWRGVTPLRRARGQDGRTGWHPWHPSQRTQRQATSRLPPVGDDDFDRSAGGERNYSGPFAVDQGSMLTLSWSRGRALSIGSRTRSAASNGAFVGQPEAFPPPAKRRGRRLPAHVLHQIPGSKPREAGGAAAGSPQLPISSRGRRGPSSRLVRGTQST